MNVRFIDTSIMLNILKVPGRCNEYERVAQEWNIAIANHDTLIMPMATIIETGNHIAHIPNGSERRTVADKFKEYLYKMSVNEAPWTLYGTNLNSEDLKYLADNFVTFATSEVGIGDMTIIQAYMKYKDTQPAIGTIMIWSTDEHLSAYREDNVSMTKRRKR